MIFSKKTKRAGRPKKRNYRRGGLAIFYSLVFIVALLVLISALPIPGNYHLYSVMSGSMAPKIKTGTLIVVTPINDYNQNDIITFRPTDAKKNNETVTHRIFEVRENNGAETFITKGDANNAPDSDEITKNRIIGKYLLGVPILGFVVGYVKTLPGLILLVIIPATVIVLEESKKIIKEIKMIIKKRAKSQKELRNQEIK